MNQKDIIKGLMIILKKTTLNLSSFKLKEYKQYMQAYNAAEKLLEND